MSDREDQAHEAWVDECNVRLAADNPVDEHPESHELEASEQSPAHDPYCLEINAHDSRYGYTTSCKCDWVTRIRQDSAAKFLIADREDIEASASRTTEPVHSNSFPSNASTEALAERKRNGWQNGSAAAETLTQARGNAASQDVDIPHLDQPPLPISTRQDTA